MECCSVSCDCQLFSAALCCLVDLTIGFSPCDLSSLDLSKKASKGWGMLSSPQSQSKRSESNCALGCCGLADLGQTDVLLSAESLVSSAVLYQPLKALLIMP